MTRDEHVQNQAEFVRELADRLQKTVEARAGTISGVQGMANYTQIQSDIKRLRRELQELSNMIGCQYRR